MYACVCACRDESIELSVRFLFSHKLSTLTKKRKPTRKGLFRAIANYLVTYSYNFYFKILLVLYSKVLIYLFSVKLLFIILRVKIK